MEELFEIGVVHQRSYAGQIARSIETLHQSRVIHFDLSPSNLKKDREGRVTVIDFGRAGYLGDQVPPDKRRPGWNGEPYSTDHDIDALKRLLGTSASIEYPVLSNWARNLQSKLMLRGSRGGRPPGNNYLKG